MSLISSDTVYSLEDVPFGFNVQTGKSSEDIMMKLIYLRICFSYVLQNEVDAVQIGVYPLISLEANDQCAVREPD